VFDRDRLRAAALGGFALATDLAEALVRAGVPFRQAHERVGEFVSECERRGLELDEIKRKNLLATFPELEDAPLDLLRPDAAVVRRTASLGPAPEPIRAQLAGLRELLAR
jgi:argininosuccinate lyase